MKRVAFYTRVSTSEQTTENQELQLRSWAERAGLHEAVVGTFTDEGISGRHEGRPGLSALRHAIARREVNTVVVAALDRLGRSLAHLTALLAEWSALGVQLVSLREAVDTSTPTGRALMQMAGVFAELEAEFIRERTRAGLARARARGKKLGRPRVNRARRAAAKELLLKRKPVALVAARMDLGLTTVYRIRDELVQDGALAR